MAQQHLELEELERLRHKLIDVFASSAAMPGNEFAFEQALEAYERKLKLITRAGWATKKQND